MRKGHGVHVCEHVLVVWCSYLRFDSEQEGWYEHVQHTVAMRWG